MKTRFTLLLPACFVFLAACGDKKKEETAAVEVSDISKALADADTPILPVKKGDLWKYSVRTEIPAGIVSETAAAVDTTSEMKREYIGKIQVTDKKPVVDAFEVTMPGQPVQRELVEIFDNRVMMRGSILPEQPDAKPTWLDPAVPFVFAGMRPGQETADFSVFEGNWQRAIQVVARETVTVPAGDFEAIRLLMTGKDGELVIRKTSWFSPRTGIVKEETVRYVGDKLMYRSTTELLETTANAE